MLLEESPEDRVRLAVAARYLMKEEFVREVENNNQRELVLADGGWEWLGEDDNVLDLDAALKHVSKRWDKHLEQSDAMLEGLKGPLLAPPPSGRV